MDWENHPQNMLIYEWKSWMVKITKDYGNSKSISTKILKWQAPMTCCHPITPIPQLPSVWPLCKWRSLTNNKICNQRPDGTKTCLPESSVMAALPTSISLLQRSRASPSPTNASSVQSLDSNCPTSIKHPIPSLHSLNCYYAKGTPPRRKHSLTLQPAEIYQVN